MRILKNSKKTIMLFFICIFCFVNNYSLMKEMSFLIVIIFFILYAIENNLFSLKKTELEHYILYTIIITNTIIIIVFFLLLFLNYLDYIIFNNENLFFKRIFFSLIAFPIILLIINKNDNHYDLSVNNKFLRRAEFVFRRDPIINQWLNIGKIIVEKSFLIFLLYLVTEKYLLKVEFFYFIKLSISIYMYIVMLYFIIVFIYALITYIKIWKKYKKHK